jgi:arylsulfatase
VFTTEALRFIEENRARPFFLYAAYTIPHAKWDVPDDSLAEYADAFPVDPTEQQKFGANRPNPRAVYAAMITRLDRDVGRILAKLAALGLDRDTIVFFCSDNGATPKSDAGPGVVKFFNSRGPLREWKRHLYEGGIRTPMIVRWPGRVPAGRRSEHVWAGWDFMPTAAELAGTKLPTTTTFDGVSALPALVGDAPPRPGYLYWENPDKKALQQAVRVGDLKAIRLGARQPIEVYDVHADRGEKHDIAKEHPDFVRRAEELFRTARTPSEHWPTP